MDTFVYVMLPRKCTKNNESLLDNFIFLHTSLDHLIWYSKGLPFCLFAHNTQRALVPEQHNPVNLVALTESKQ